MDGQEKFLLTELPVVDAIYISLTEKTISEEKYERAQYGRNLESEICELTHDLNLDALLLADVFENLRQTCNADYGLDSCR